MADVENLNLEKELRELIAGIIEIDPEKITPEANFIEDLGMDSMMALEILASIEKKYKIRIPEENLTKIASLKKVIQVISDFLNQKSK